MDKEELGSFLVHVGAWLGCYSSGCHYWLDSELLCALSGVIQKIKCVSREDYKKECAVQSAHLCLSPEL
jgi:hypothetical protein